MKMKIGLAFCSLFLVAGCASRGYVDPVNVPVVSMEFVNNNPGYVFNSHVYEDDYDCYDVRYVAFFAKNIDHKVIKAKKREYYTIAYSYFLGSDLKKVTTCGGVYSFKVENADYKVVTGTADGKCTFQVLKRKAGDVSATWVPEPKLIKRKPHQPFLNDGPWCEADSQFKGSSSMPVPRGDGQM